MIYVIEFTDTYKPSTTKNYPVDVIIDGKTVHAEIPVKTIYQSRKSWKFKKLPLRTLT